jgi:hypothetical protein
MDRTSAQPQVNLSSLRKNSLKFQPLETVTIGRVAAKQEKATPRNQEHNRGTAHVPATSLADCYHHMLLPLLPDENGLALLLNAGVSRNRQGGGIHGEAHTAEHGTIPG